MQRQINEQSGEAAAANAIKHGLAAGDLGQPERPDWTIDQGWNNYTAEEHGVWKTLFERQSKLLPRYACDEFVQGMQHLPMGADEIPDFRRLSEALMKRTGWTVVAVPGLVPDAVRQGSSFATRTSWTTWKSPMYSTMSSATCRC
jgi:phenylalanine-4-hydroxylase